MFRRGWGFKTFFFSPLKGFTFLSIPEEERQRESAEEFNFTWRVWNIVKKLWEFGEQTLISHSSSSSQTGITKYWADWSYLQLCTFWLSLFSKDAESHFCHKKFQQCRWRQSAEGHFKKSRYWWIQSFHINISCGNTNSCVLIRASGYTAPLKVRLKCMHLLKEKLQNA